ncbi:ribosome maturation factor RimP [Streptococcus mutans]|uniref:ribosome maturation factor RimP n=1 Tax=Streptococcus mutans TaxID=1309 RepID=UPI0002DB8CA7|nr:ribosome maturation factor RimP [Streptococcus mutans]
MCKEENTIATLVDIVRPVVAPVIPKPFELVDIEYEKLGGNYVLSILVDKPEGITVEDTADLTDIISPLLDTIKPDPFPEQYMLEISSPGLERPLKTAQSLNNAVGHYINVSLYQAIDKVKVFEGDLTAFDGETLTMTYLDKTQQKTVTIPYKMVAKARLAVKL